MNKELIVKGIADNLTKSYKCWSEARYTPELRAPWQVELIGLVQEIEDAGGLYQDERTAKAAEALGLEPGCDMLMSGRGEVTNGCFGMHIYYARTCVTADKEIADMKQVEAWLGDDRAFTGEFKISSRNTFATFRIQSISPTAVATIGRVKGGRKNYGWNPSPARFLEIMAAATIKSRGV